MAGPPGRDSSPLILEIPPRVLEEFCRCMDCLSDWEWMRFASCVISDQTDLRSIRSVGKMGTSVTRELLWSWGQRLATLQDLTHLLQDLQLYRAMDILHQWMASQAEERMEANSPVRKHSNMNRNRPTERELPDSTAAEHAAYPLACPPAPSLDMLGSLQPISDLGLLSCTQDRLHVPHQETNSVISSAPLLWAKEEVERATDGFSEDKKIHSGEFADVFTGRKADKVYAIKRLKETEGEQQKKVQSFFHTETEIRFRCRHANLLQLLGVCVERGCHCLIYQFLRNGSLDCALQQGGAPIRSWERRVAVALGILQAVGHLHEAGICHGNIRSSNVFLDENFAPKLGHSGLRFCPGVRTGYTQAKTKEQQWYQPYLPDSFVRGGQLTEAIDIFACGVVLAEIMTGLKACDDGRRPVYLKDLILEQMETVKSDAESIRACAGGKTATELCAQEVSRKYADRGAGQLPEAVLLYFSTAICLCLSKKKPVLSEVYAVMEKAGHHFRDQRELRTSSRVSQEEMFSVNVPEESDYAESLSSECIVGAILEVPSSSSDIAQSLACPIPRDRCPRTGHRDSERSTPCETDAPSSSIFPRTGSWDQAQLPRQNTPCEGPETSCSPSGSGPPSWGIELTKEKQQLMRNIGLYQDGSLDSSVLFDSS
ncbi:hypothetical protein FKM82_004385 [Ascaphus truei]